jgi:hypothetical protein
MLYKKGAEVGLRPDGFVTRPEDEHIEAGKIIDEQIQEVNERNRHVFNPAIGEFVAMMGQIDEFKRIRTRIKEAAISENLSPKEVDKLDKDVKNFLSRPEITEAFNKAKMSEEDVYLAIPALLGEPSEVLVETRMAFWGKFFSEIKNAFAAIGKIITRENAKAGPLTQKCGENFSPKDSSQTSIGPEVTKQVAQLTAEKERERMLLERRRQVAKTHWQMAMFSEDGIFAPPPAVGNDILGETFCETSDELVREASKCNAKIAKFTEKYGMIAFQAAIEAVFSAEVALGALEGGAVGSAAGPVGTAIGATMGGGMVILGNFIFGEVINHAKNKVSSSVASMVTNDASEEEAIKNSVKVQLDIALAFAGLLTLPGAAKSMGNRAANLPTSNIFGKGHGIPIREIELAGTGLKVKVPVEEHVEVPTSMSLKQEKVPGQRNITNAGSGKELVDGVGQGGFLDGKDVHHIVPQRYLKKHGINPDDGLSVVLPKEVHAQTNTYKNKAKKFDLDQSFRDATADGLKDLIKVEKEHGIYESGGRENLIKGLEKHKLEHPKLYEKGTTK